MCNSAGSRARVNIAHLMSLLSAIIMERLICVAITRRTNSGRIGFVAVLCTFCMLIQFGRRQLIKYEPSFPLMIIVFTVKHKVHHRHHCIIKTKLSATCSNGNVFDIRRKLRIARLYDSTFCISIQIDLHSKAFE